MDVLPLGDVIDCICDEIIMRIFLSHRFLLLSLLLLACGSNRGDPLAPGNSLLPGAGRANLALIESNQYEACQVSLDLIVDNYYKATSVISNANDPASQVRIIGNHSSYAFVSVVAPDSNGTSDPYSLNLEIKYKDYYSETGKLFISGALEMYGSAVGNASHLSELHLYGTVEITGDYAYTVEFDGFGVGLDANGQAINLPFAYAKYWVCGPTYTLPNAGTL